MSVLDNVKKGLGPIETPSLGSVQENLFDQASALQGKERSTSAASGRVSNLSVRRAQGKAKLQQQNLETQVQNQAGALQAQEQQQEQQIQTAARGLTVKETQVREAALQKAEEIITAFEQSKDKLSLAKREATVEQAKFLLRLNADKYTTQLEIMGNRMRLQDKVRFEEELTKAVWDYDRQTLERSLDLQSLMRMDKREFEAEMRTMEVELALELAEMGVEADMSRQKYEGLQRSFSGAIEGGVEGYKAYKEYEESKKSTSKD